MSDKIKMWMCRKYIKHIEYLEKSIIEYKERLRTHLNALSELDLFKVMIDTGYVDKEQEKAFKRAFMRYKNKGGSIN